MKHIFSELVWVDIKWLRNYKSIELGIRSGRQLYLFLLKEDMYKGIISILIKGEIYILYP